MSASIPRAPLRLGVGKTYLNRSGEKVTITSQNPNAPLSSVFKFRDAPFSTYRADGRLLADRETSRDLVSEADGQEASAVKGSRHAELIQQWALGATVQTPNRNQEWEDLDGPGGVSQPAWHEDFEYRIKPAAPSSGTTCTASASASSASAKTPTRSLPTSCVQR